jgi:hypothetical protein
MHFSVAGEPSAIVGLLAYECRIERAGALSQKQQPDSFPGFIDAVPSRHCVGLQDADLEGPARLGDRW